MVSRPGGRRVTVRDIAAQTGVSIATVSRVLNGQDHVAPETRDLVRTAAERLRAGSPAAPGPARAPAGAVYLRCPYLLTDYFGLIVSAVAETLALHGRAVLLDAGTAAQQASVLPSLASRPGIAGAIVILPPEPGEQLAALRTRGFPLVVVDPRTPVPRDIAAVSAAHFAGARSMTAHLAGLGHRRIGVIAGPHNWLAGQARLAGHASALADAGVLHPAELTRAGEPTTEFGYRAAGELLARPVRPTALVCFNDKTAVGALAAAAERGLRVPGDLSVTGFDDIDLAQAASPALTTVRQPLAEMGRMAVSLLIRLLDRHQVDALHVELATELIVRGSTGPALGGPRHIDEVGADGSTAGGAAGGDDRVAWSKNAGCCDAADWLDPDRAVFVDGPAGVVGYLPDVAVGVGERARGAAPVHGGRGAADGSAVPCHWPSYSSWRRHQGPVSLRPRGARSSHWYMPHRPSIPRS